MLRLVLESMFLVRLTLVLVVTVCVAVGRLLATTVILTLVVCVLVIVVVVLVCSGLVKLSRFLRWNGRFAVVLGRGLLVIPLIVIVSMCRLCMVSVLILVVSVVCLVGLRLYRSVIVLGVFPVVICSVLLLLC